LRSRAHAPSWVARSQKNRREIDVETQKRMRWVPLAIGSGVLMVVLLGTWMVRHAESKSDQIALADHPMPVTVVEPEAAQYRPSRTYVGTIEPWVEAKIGPQLVSAYVDTVLVRPGAVVKKGEVLATLDCRNATAMSRAVTMQARALEARQKAVASEAARVRGLLDGGFVSPNEAEQKSAQSASEQAQLLAEQARMLGSSLEVNDCVLRAPFAGEVATRTIDPGAFVRPGSSLLTVVDRSTVRVVADAPEVDFDVVKPGSKVMVHCLATNADMSATIARRAPAALASTRTVHFEIDVPDPQRQIPVGTTAEIRIDVGTPEPALKLPLMAAAVRGTNANLFVVEDNVAHVRVLPVMGELAGQLFLAPQLPAGAHVVTEGRELLNDGDRVAPGLERQSTAHHTEAAKL
jgi:RND family efflux transporter MFP subunit